ncbi:MAG TPA: hypothetical protein VF637_07885 [Sphingomicrobium sp.]|jgi:hypothetical protein
MIWRAGLTVFAACGLIGPALVWLVLPFVVKFTRSLGPGAAIYVAIFIAVGIVAS